MYPFFLNHTGAGLARPKSEDKARIVEIMDTKLAFPNNKKHETKFPVWVWLNFRDDVEERDKENLTPQEVCR